jgi:hypothetical protein
VLNQVNPLGEGKKQIKYFSPTYNLILKGIEKRKMKTPILGISNIGPPN